MLEDLFPALTHLQAALVVTKPLAVPHGELAPGMGERRITGRRGVGLDTIPGYAACQGCLQEREERVCHFLERKIRAGVRSEAHPSVGERAGRSFQQGPDLWFNAAV